MKPPHPILFVVGPTASGKETLALAMARRLGGEVVSMDSMKVYRGMDIGTAKALAEERREVPHHLIDVADPWEPYSVKRYVDEAARAVADIRARGKVPVVSGGTPLYFKAMLDGLFEGPAADWALRRELAARARAEGSGALHRDLAAADPAAAGRIHPNDERRIVRALEVLKLTGRPISAHQRQWGPGQARSDCFAAGLRWEKEALHRRINRRAERMFELGLAREVRGLLAHPRGMGPTARQAVGYKEVIAHLEGRSTAEEALVAVKKWTRHFAKHQMTWFKRFGMIQWIGAGEGIESEALAESVVDHWREATR